MICVETEAERDSRGWNGLDGDVERRDVDEGEPGNRMEVGEDWLTRAVGMVENEGGGDVVVGHAGGRGRGGQTGGGCGTNAGAEQTHTKGNLRIRAGGLDRAKGRVSIRNVERTTASGTTGGVAGAVVPDEEGGPILVVEGYSVSGDEDGRESDDVRDDVQSGDGGGDGVADTGIARGCEREETTCGGGGTAPGARCGSMDETLTKTAGELVKQRQALEQQDAENVTAMEIENENQTRKPKRDALQETLGLGGQWMVVLYDSGERAFSRIESD